MFKLIKCCLCLSLTASVLFGCVSKEELAKQEATRIEKEAQLELQTQLTEKITRLEESSKQWQAVQPGVERLVNIEDELNDLITQLNTIIIEAEKPNQRTNKKASQHSPKVTPSISSITKEAGYTLQLSSISNVEKVESAWLEIYKKNSSILSAYQPLVETVDIQNKIYYRIKAGNFSSRSAAQNVCEQLKSKNTSCLTNIYTGETMQQFKINNNL